MAEDTGGDLTTTPLPKEDRAMARISISALSLSSSNEAKPRADDRAGLARKPQLGFQKTQ
jgi:hypothetical protein